MMPPFASHRERRPAINFCLTYSASPIDAMMILSSGAIDFSVIEPFKKDDARHHREHDIEYCYMLSCRAPLTIFFQVILFDDAHEHRCRLRDILWPMISILYEDDGLHIHFRDSLASLRMISAKTIANAVAAKIPATITASL